jgi:hypothetical protein
LSDDPRELSVQISGERLKALFVHLKDREEELDRDTFATLNTIERTLFEHMSIEEVEQLIADRTAQRGGS